MTNLSLHRLLRGFLAGIAIAVSAGDQAPLPKFSVPPGDLARAHVGDFRITFMANGAFVLARRGQYLFDGGVGFSLTGWKRWGDQIRRNGPADTRRPLKNGRGIVFNGTILDLHGKPTLSCKETVVGLPGGLRFDYELQPTEDLSLAHLGPTFHWPASRFMSQPLALSPGFVSGALGKKPRSLLLFPLASAPYALLSHEGRPFVALAPTVGARWKAHDDRRYQLNVARLWCTPRLPRVAKQGSPMRMGFDLHLLPLAPLPELELGGDHLQVDYVGVGHLLVGGKRAAQMGLCWRSKPGDPWRYALAAPRRSKLGSAQGESEGISFDGPVGGVFRFGLVGKRQDTEFRLDWNVAKIKNPLPAEMGVWLISRKEAKPTVPSTAEQKDGPGRFEIATDAHTTVTVETDGEWSCRVQKLWGAECLLAIARFATNGQPSVQRTAAIRVVHSGDPAQTKEAKAQDE